MTITGERVKMKFVHRVKVMNFFKHSGIILNNERSTKTKYCCSRTLTITCLMASFDACQVFSWFSWSVSFSIQSTVRKSLISRLSCSSLCSVEFWVVSRFSSLLLKAFVESTSSTKILKQR